MESLAIIGMSCRFSGDATNPEKFWDLLVNKKSTWSEIPESRFRAEGVYHPNQKKKGLSSVRGGHFLEQDLSHFDASFFSFPAELAASLDPQYRLELEVVYEALENAGIPLHTIKGTNTSVYAGACFRDYHDSLIRDPDTLPRSFMTGNGVAMASNRISHFYDLRGPSMTVDTACSTTLTALHLAVQGLRSRESDLSIVSGASLNINPDLYIALSDLGVLSPDGISYSFDDRANGYGRGEGVAAIIVKRLDDALRDGDSIRAIIRETALNQDGKTPTITSPSQQAQEELIATCYRRAGIDPTETAFIEAHGTGTPIGDPIEVAAIGSVFRKTGTDTQPKFVGSLKTNIGHTEATSGLASIIKAILALEKAVIPPNIHFDRPNPGLRLEEWGLEVPRDVRQWPEHYVVRRASVNNFGYGGANAHVILEAHETYNSPVARPKSIKSRTANDDFIDAVKFTDGTTDVDSIGSSNSTHGTDTEDSSVDLDTAYSTDTSVRPDSVRNKLSRRLASARRAEYVNRESRNDFVESEMSHATGVPSQTLQSRVFMLSANDEDALESMKIRLKDYVLQRAAQDGKPFLDDIAYTLGSRRSIFKFTSALAATSPESLASALENATLQPIRAIKNPRIGFVFTGQGAQWARMGQELINTYPVFRRTLVRADEHVRSLGAEWSLIDELQRDAGSSRVNDLAFSLPLCTALQLGLVELLSSWGIKPTAVVGHSGGEIAAAYAAGALDLESAIAIPYLRGNLTVHHQAFINSSGGMLAVGLGRNQVNEYIGNLSSGFATVACVNSQISVTVAGDISALDELETVLKEQKVFARRVKVNAAFHSPQMAPIAEPYAEILKNVFKPGQGFGSVVFSSATTGSTVSDAETIANPSYWIRNMLQPVEFEAAFLNMCFDKSGEQPAPRVDVILEVGAHGALGGPIKQMMELTQFEDVSLPYRNCLVRGKDAVETTHRLVCDLLSLGIPVNVDAVNFPHGRYGVKVLNDLPSYAWSHKVRHWREPRLSRALRYRPNRPNDLLGSRLPGSNTLTPTWKHIIRASDLPWIREHTVQSQIVYPGAGLICMALEGANQLYENQSDNISHYDLRDVDIARALVIPDDEDGIEVQMTVLPCSEKSLGSHDWHDFRLYSIADDPETWTEHCKGQISVKFGSETLPATLPHRLGRSSQAVNPDKLFKSLRDTGIFHGPLFQNIDNILVDDAAQAEVQFGIAKVDSTLSSHRQDEYTIHPTTLDSVFLAAYSPLTRSAKFSGSGYVPRSIKHLRLSGHMKKHSGHKLKAFSSINRLDSQKLQAGVSVTDVGDPNIVLEISGLTCQSLGVLGSPKNDVFQRRICSTVHWEVDPSVTEPSKIKEMLLFKDDAAEQSLMAELKTACLHYMRKAIDTLSPADLENLHGHLEKFYKWMTFQLSKNSTDAVLGSGEESTLLKRVATATVNGEMITRLGSNLMSILRGEVSALELMRHDNLLTRYYIEALKWDRSIWQAGRLAKLCAHKSPAANILEIGGGTGGATEAVLAAISEVGTGTELPIGHYHFTDISAGFFEAAKERFSAYNHLMSFQKLDIECDPEAQGFQLGSYDIVVAAQVLHATKNLETTVSNVRKLLKPGGKLILIETTNDQVDVFFAFGLLPGWWLSEEKEREFTPSLAKQSWDRVLKSCGFSGLDVEVQDCQSPEHYMISTITSTAVEPINGSLPPTVIVTTDASPSGQWLGSLREAVFSLIGKLPDIEHINVVNGTDKICIFLDLPSGIMRNAAQKQFDSIRSLLTTARGVLWVSHGGAMEGADPDAAIHIGFLRTMRNETGGRRYVSLDLDATRQTWHSDCIQTICNVFRSTFIGSFENGTKDFEYTEQHGSIYTPRLFDDTTLNTALDENASQPEMALEPFHQPEKPVRMAIGIPGSLDSLYFHDDPNATKLIAGDEIEIDPKAFGINFRDVMVAMGRLEQNAFMGFECAGTIVRLGKEAAAQGFKVGERICTVLQGHWATLPRASWKYVARIPDDMAYEVAASIPLVYCTAYVSLYEVANLQKGEKILIHAATGGVGQAAITFAQNIGAEIFVTAGTAGKRELVKENFGIPDDHIFSSRDVSFAEGVLKSTQGKGVDVVLNSLSGKLLQESFNCLGDFGRFVEIGKRDLEQNSSLDMFPFTRNVSFAAVDLNMWAEHKPERISRILNATLDLLRTNAIRTISPITTYPISDIEKAFRTMQTGNHLGKLVVSVGATDLVPTRKAPQAVTLPQDASYLIVGGMTGVGRSICQWMIDHGAKNLIILSRSARRDSFVELLERGGCKVLCLPCNVASENDLAYALEQSRACMPQIKGVVQGAMVLKDSIIENMTLDDFKTAIFPKVKGSWNLHNQIPDLGFFIMLSSVCGIIGNKGQANYAAGGAFQDALCHYRRARGLPAVTIDLGQVSSVGYVAESGNKIVSLERIGVRPLDTAKIHRLLETCISTTTPAQIITGINTGPGSHWDEQTWAKDARFASLKYRKVETVDVITQSSGTDSILATLATTTSAEESQAVLGKALTTKLASMFMVSVDSIAPTQRLNELGVDSLVAVELKNWLASSVGCEISIFELTNNTSLKELVATLVGKWR